jgi:uncharacterized protein YgiM (DUF1202 family)
MKNRCFLIKRSTRESIGLLLLWLALSLGCTSTDSNVTDTLSRSALTPTPSANSSQSTERNLNSQANNSPQGTGKAVIISTKANLREGPGASRPILLEVVKDDALSLVSHQHVGQWYKVTHLASGKVGWINGYSIKLLDPQTTVTTSQPLQEEYPSPRSSSIRLRKADASTSRGLVRSETAPSGASARCSDGTYSFSQNRRGTCSHHGGVAQWL